MLNNSSTYSTCRCFFCPIFITDQQHTSFTVDTLFVVTIPTHCALLFLPFFPLYCSCCSRNDSSLVCILLFQPSSQIPFSSCLFMPIAFSHVSCILPPLDTKLPLWMPQCHEHRLLTPFLLLRQHLNKM